MDSRANAMEPSPYSSADCLRFSELTPSETSDGGSTWYGRGQNFVLGYSAIDGELEFSRHEQPDEYALILADESVSADITVDGREQAVKGGTLTFVPPGDSTVRLSGTGRAIRLVTARASDLAEKAANAASYSTQHPGVTPLEPWPEPIGGYRLRSYDLDVPTIDNPRFRLFRGSTFMVNYLDPREGPRPLTELSPHSHDDFEQCMLFLTGTYQIHLRWPWTRNLEFWREDEHMTVDSPTMLIVPPHVIHATNVISEGTNHYIDIFSPPRADYSSRDGWVLNAADYPLREAYS